MTTQSFTKETSDILENEDVQEIEDLILVPANAGTSLRTLTNDKRKVPANSEKNKQGGVVKLLPG